MLVVDFWKFMIQNCVSFSPSILSIRWIKNIVPKYFLKVEKNHLLFYYVLHHMKMFA